MHYEDVNEFSADRVRNSRSHVRAGSARVGTGRRILIVVENLPVPLDRRFWMEATTLVANGYEVSVICPTGYGWDKLYEEIEGVHIYRYLQDREADSGAVDYAQEYWYALRNMFCLARVVARERGFDVIQGCNPPDLIFLLALRYRLSGVRYIFDHHDACPELYEAKFGRKGTLFQIMRLCERITFAVADVSMATNESFRAIAMSRGKMDADDVFVVRSAPEIESFLIGPADDEIREGAQTLIGYVGVIGKQDGLDLLVAAADRLIRNMGYDDVHFAVVGFGSQLEEVQREVSERGLDAYFTFTGALYGDDLLQVLNSADICVCPDPKNAMNDISTMNKIMEYMTLEKPMVQFDLEEGRASAGDAALYAEANDIDDFAAKIAWLIDHPDEAREMGRRGRVRMLQRLEWHYSAPALLAAYDRVYAKIRGEVPRRLQSGGDTIL